MNDQTQQNVRELLVEAVDLPAGERSAFLDRACGDDATLRGEVEALIRALEATGGFLETPPLGVDVADIARWAEPEAMFVGKQVGRYTLDRVIATGGMGTVYEAHIEGSGEVYAVKLVKSGLVSESALRRFEHEAALLSLLDHECIARMHDAGSFDTGLGEVPFFAMEYVRDAMAVTEYAAAKKLDTRARLDLFLKICSAIEHGHRKGIIHRDLKPGNILVDAGGRLKVIDFGVARATEVDVTLASQHTAHGQLVGTLQYMSPEQCAGDSRDSDTRSDVYSLGVVLFELLTGSLPYDLHGVPLSDAMQIVREHAPTRPSSHDQALSGDLETIVLKALEKERDRRYGSVAELGGDVERYLNNEPIRARSPSAVYLMRKFAKRNKGVVVGGSVALLALVSATAISTDFALDEARARATVEQKNIELEAVNEFVAEIFQAGTPDQALGREVTVREALDRASLRIGDSFSATPLVEATIRCAIGNAYMTLGAYEDSMLHYESAHVIRKRELGARHPDTAYALGGYAWSLAYAGHSAEAIEPLETVIALLTDTEGADHPEVIRGKTVLVLAMIADLRYDDAEPIARQVLEQAHLVDSGWRHVALNNLGKVLIGQGRFEEALEIFQPLYDEIVGASGESDPDETAPQGITMILNNLGQCLVELHRYEEAERHLARAVKIANNVFTPDNDFSLRYANNFAGLLAKLGRLQDAEELYLDVLERRKRVLGDTHPHTAATMQSLGDLYQGELARFDEAERYLLEAHALLDSVVGKDSSRTKSTIESIIKLYDAWGKPEQAEQWRARLAAG